MMRMLPLFLLVVHSMSTYDLQQSHYRLSSNAGPSRQVTQVRANVHYEGQRVVPICSVCPPPHLTHQPLPISPSAGVYRHVNQPSTRPIPPAPGVREIQRPTISPQLKKRYRYDEVEQEGYVSPQPPVHTSRSLQKRDLDKSYVAQDIVAPGKVFFVQVAPDQSAEEEDDDDTDYDGDDDYEDDPGESYVVSLINAGGMGQDVHIQVDSPPVANYENVFVDDETTVETVDL